MSIECLGPPSLGGSLTCAIQGYDYCDAPYGGSGECANYSTTSSSSGVNYINRIDNKKLKKMSYSNFNRGRGQLRSYEGDCKESADCVSSRGDDCKPCCKSECINGTCEHTAIPCGSIALNQGKRSTWTAGASQSQPYIMSAPAGGGTIGPAAASIGFSGDMYPSSCGTQSATTSVGEYVVGMGTVGMLFFIIGYSLRKGGDLA